MKTLWLRIAERVERAFYGERDHYVPGDDGMYVMKYIAPKQETSRGAPLGNPAARAM